MTELNRN